MRISDWSSDVCSSDLERVPACERSLIGGLHDRRAMGFAALYPSYEAHPACRMGRAQRNPSRTVNPPRTATERIHGADRVRFNPSRATGSTASHTCPSPSCRPAPPPLPPLPPTAPPHPPPSCPSRTTHAPTHP